MMIMTKTFLKRLHQQVSIALLALCLTAVSAMPLYAASRDKPIRWHTKTLNITLAAPDAGMGLMSIKHTKQGAQFLKQPTSPDDALLWKIRLTNDISKKNAF